MKAATSAKIAHHFKTESLPHRISAPSPVSVPRGNGNPCQHHRLDARATAGGFPARTPGTSDAEESVYVPALSIHSTQARATAITCTSSLRNPATVP